MFSVRLVSADSYQAQPLPQLDPTFSEFRGSDIKHVPIIRIFGTTSNGEKTCLHIHGVFPYLYVPYTGEEDPTRLAYRLAASLDAAINVSLGSATSNTQHVYLIKRVSGIPFYGYHRKEHQYLKIYFYNPAMIKRAADLLQNGSVLNQSLQPHEAHIPYLLQFMIDYNVYGMSLVNLSGVKHRRLAQTLAELASSGQSATSENSEIEYLPATIERQSTCEIEVDALASDIMNRREIESGLELNPGLAAIWEEERARRAQAGLEGGDSQLVNPKSPQRPVFRPTDNDIYQEQRLARRLLMISQCDESSLSTTTTNQSIAYAAEVQDGENLLNSSHLLFSRPAVEAQVVERDDSTLHTTTFPDSPPDIASQRVTPDCSILGTDDMSLIELLDQLADEGVESEDFVDMDSVLGSQVSALLNDERNDIDYEDDVADLNLTSLQLDSLCSVDIPAGQGNESSRSDQNPASTVDLSQFISPYEISSSSRSADEEKTKKECRVPQYDGAGDVSPTLLNSDDEDNGTNAKEFSHLPEYNGNRESSSKSQKFEHLEGTLKIPASNASATSKDGAGTGETFSSSSTVEVAGANDDSSSLLPVLSSDAYLAQYNGLSYEPFDRLLEIGPEFAPDLEGLHSSMEIGILLSNADSDSPESVDEALEDDVIPIETVLNGDPCFTESAELDKSDLTELQDQYVSLLGNSLLPDLHANLRIDSDLGNSSNLSDSDYQTGEKPSEILLTVRSPRSSVTSRESSSSSENVAPNIQEPETKGLSRGKFNASFALDRESSRACKDSSRISADNSDYNCNVVATWAELQNLQFLEKEKIDGRIGRSKERTGPRQSRRRASRRSDEKAASQILRFDSEKFNNGASTLAHLQVTGNCTLSPRKIVASTASTSPMKKSSNSPSSSSIMAEVTLVETALTGSLIDLVGSKCLGSPRVPHIAAEIEIEQESMSADYEADAGLETLTESIIAAESLSSMVEDSLLATCALDGTESNAGATADFAENQSEAFDDPSKAKEIPEGFSYYSSQSSQRGFTTGDGGGFEHRHCMLAKDNRIVQDEVFTSDQVWIIEKRKRGRQVKWRQRSVCTSGDCAFPIVPLRKIDGSIDEIPAVVENSTNIEDTETPVDENTAKPTDNETPTSVSDEPLETSDSPEKRAGPRTKSGVGRRRTESLSSESSVDEPSSSHGSLTEDNNDNDSINEAINSVVRASLSESQDPESSDWAETEGRGYVSQRFSASELSQNPYGMRRRYSRKKRLIVRNSKKSISTRASKITRNGLRRRVPRSVMQEEPDLPGIPGNAEYRPSRKRSCSKKGVFACCNSVAGEDKPSESSRRTRKRLQSVLFPNWEPKLEVSRRRKNGLVNGLQNGFADARKTAISPDRRAINSPQFDFPPVSPIPKRNRSPRVASKDLSFALNGSSTPKKIGQELDDKNEENECVTLNMMIGEVKSRSTRAKLKMLLESRKSKRTNSLKERETKANMERGSLGSERPLGETEAATPVTPKDPKRPLIPATAEDARNPEEVDDRLDADNLTRDLLEASFETVSEVSDTNRIICEPEANSFEAMENTGNFVNSTSNADLCHDDNDDTTETYDVEELKIGRHSLPDNPTEESSNECTELSYRSEQFASSIAQQNLFSGPNYTIDAVSLEMPADLFEEDSDSVDKRSPKKVTEIASQSSNDSRNANDACSDISVDPRDVDVCDVESLTPSSSLANLNEIPLDLNDTLLTTSEITETSVAESSAHSEAPSTSVSPEKSQSNSKSEEVQDSSFEEASPEFEALSPSPQICDLGTSLEDEFTIHSTSKIALHAEKSNNSSVNNTIDDSLGEASTKNAAIKEDNSQLDHEIQDLVSQVVVQLETESNLPCESELPLTTETPPLSIGETCKEVEVELEIERQDSEKTLIEKEDSVPIAADEKKLLQASAEAEKSLAKKSDCEIMDLFAITSNTTESDALELQMEVQESVPRGSELICGEIESRDKNENESIVLSAKEPMESDENNVSTETEACESKSQQPADVSKDELPKKPLKCRRVSIKLVNIDLSRFEGFQPRKLAKSERGSVESNETEASTEKNLPESTTRNIRDESVEEEVAPVERELMEQATPVDDNQSKTCGKEVTSEPLIAISEEVETFEAANATESKTSEEILDESLAESIGMETTTSPEISDETFGKSIPMESTTPVEIVDDGNAFEKIVSVELAEISTEEETLDKTITMETKSSSQSSPRKTTEKTSKASRTPERRSTRRCAEETRRKLSHQASSQSSSTEVQQSTEEIGETVADDFQEQFHSGLPNKEAEKLPGAEVTLPEPQLDIVSKFTNPQSAAESLTSDNLSNFTEDSLTKQTIARGPSTEERSAEMSLECVSQKVPDENTAPGIKWRKRCRGPKSSEENSRDASPEVNASREENSPGSHNIKSMVSHQCTSLCKIRTGRFVNIKLTRPLQIKLAAQRLAKASLASKTTAQLISADKTDQQNTPLLRLRLASQKIVQPDGETKNSNGNSATGKKFVKNSEPSEEKSPEAESSKISDFPKRIIVEDNVDTNSSETSKRRNRSTKVPDVDVQTLSMESIATSEGSVENTTKKFSKGTELPSENIVKEKTDEETRLDADNSEEARGQRIPSESPSSLEEDVADIAEKNSDASQLLPLTIAKVEKPRISRIRRKRRRRLENKPRLHCRKAQRRKSARNISKANSTGFDSSPEKIAKQSSERLARLRRGRRPRKIPKIQVSSQNDSSSRDKSARNIAEETCEAIEESPSSPEKIGESDAESQNSVSIETAELSVSNPSTGGNSQNIIEEISQVSSEEISEKEIYEPEISLKAKKRGRPRRNSERNLSKHSAEATLSMEEGSHENSAEKNHPIPEEPKSSQKIEEDDNASKTLASAEVPQLSASNPAPEERPRDIAEQISQVLPEEVEEKSIEPEIFVKTKKRRRPRKNSAEPTSSLVESSPNDFGETTCRVVDESRLSQKIEENSESKTEIQEEIASSQSPEKRPQNTSENVSLDILSQNFLEKSLDSEVSFKSRKRGRPRKISQPNLNEPLMERRPSIEEGARNIEEKSPENPEEKSLEIAEETKLLPQEVGGDDDESKIFADIDIPKINAVSLTSVKVAESSQKIADASTEAFVKTRKRGRPRKNSEQRVQELSVEPAPSIEDSAQAADENTSANPEKSKLTQKLEEEEKEEEENKSKGSLESPASVTATEESDQRTEEKSCEVLSKKIDEKLVELEALTDSSLQQNSNEDEDSCSLYIRLLSQETKDTNSAGRDNSDFSDLVEKSSAQTSSMEENARNIEEKVAPEVDSPSNNAEEENIECEIPLEMKTSELKDEKKLSLESKSSAAEITQEGAKEVLRENESSLTNSVDKNVSSMIFVERRKRSNQRQTRQNIGLKSSSESQLSLEKSDRDNVEDSEKSESLQSLQEEHTEPKSVTRRRNHLEKSLVSNTEKLSTQENSKFTADAASESLGKTPATPRRRGRSEKTLESNSLERESVEENSGTAAEKSSGEAESSTCEDAEAKSLVAAKRKRRPGNNTESNTRSATSENKDESGELEDHRETETSSRKVDEGDTENPPITPKKRGRRFTSRRGQKISAEKSDEDVAEKASLLTESLLEENAKESAEYRSAKSRKSQKSSTEKIEQGIAEATSQDSLPQIITEKPIEAESVMVKKKGRTCKISRTISDDSSQESVLSVEEIAEKVPQNISKKIELSLQNREDEDTESKSSTTRRGRSAKNSEGASRPTEEADLVVGPEIAEDEAEPKPPVTRRRKRSRSERSSEAKPANSKLPEEPARKVLDEELAEPEFSPRIVVEEIREVITQDAAEAKASVRLRKRSRSEKSPDAGFKNSGSSEEPARKAATHPEHDLLGREATEEISEAQVPERPVKRVRFDEDSIRECAIHLRSFEPQLEEKIGAKSSAKEDGNYSLTMLRCEPNPEAARRRKNRRRSRKTRRITRPRTASRSRDVSTLGEGENPQETASLEAPQGNNGAADKSESVGRGDDNACLDLPSLQDELPRNLRITKSRAQEQLAARGKEKLPSTSTRNESKVVGRTRRTQPSANSEPEGKERPALTEQRVAAVVQLREPKIVLKRLSRDTLESYGLEFVGKKKIFVEILKKRRPDPEYQVPAYDGPADFSSSDSEVEETAAVDVTVAREEKRVCVYQSGKKPTNARREATVVTPRKRKIDDQEEPRTPPSKFRAVMSDIGDSSKTTPYRSPNRTSMLKSPGRVSGYYPPLQIIVTSPKVRKETSEPRDTDVRLESPEVSASAGGECSTPRRKNNQRLHENLLRGRIAAFKSPRTDIGDKRAPVDTMGSQRPGELDEIISSEQRERNALDTPTVTSERSEETGNQILSPRDGKDARKKLVFPTTRDDRRGLATHEIPNTELDQVTTNLRTPDESMVDFSGINAAAEPLRVLENTADRQTTTLDPQPGPSRSFGARSDEDLRLYEVTTDEESGDDDACNVTFTQYVDSQIEKNQVFTLERRKIGAKTNEIVSLRPKFNPPSRRRIVDTMETYGIPKYRNKEPFFSDDADVPRQKELAQRMLKVPGKGLKDLPAFVSSLEGVTGLARWRRMKVNEFLPAVAKSKDISAIRALVGDATVSLTPLTKPPTQREVRNWLRAREYLEKRKRQEKEARKAKEARKIEIQGEIAETEETRNEEIQRSEVADSKEDECESNASDLSVIEASPEKIVGGRDDSDKLVSCTLKMKLAKRGIVKKAEDIQKSSLAPSECRKKAKDSVEPSGSREGTSATLHSNNTADDPSLLSVLEKSRLFKDQEPSRHLGVSCGQIEFLSDSTRSNVANENLQSVKALTRYQYLTVMCLEIHTNTRGDLLPDAQHDPIAAIFYSVQSDVPPTSSIKPLEHGVIIVADEEKARNKMHYSYASKFPWSVSIADNEEALLNALVTLITRTDPEILIGWELETLSWGYVFQRASRLGMNLSKRISRIPATQCKWEAPAPEVESLADVKLPGRIVLDIWRIMRHEAALLSYTFESMMHHILNERVPCPSFKILTDWWNLERPRPSRWRVVEHYSLRVLGVFRILDQLDIIGRTSELARLFGIQFYEVFSRGSQYRVESVMHRLAKPLNYIAVSPTPLQRASMRAMEALPLIMEPESMFYSDPLIVLDFQSLYPSIIIAHNYCFSTCLGRIEHIGQPQPFEFGAYTLRVPKSAALKLQGKVNFAPCGVAFVKPEVRQGILPRMLTEILDTRLMVKKAMKDHKQADKTLQRALHSRQLGLKLLANVTYGYTSANFSGRMPCIEVGDSVVSKAKETLERAIKLVEATPKWGARVVYGDTDSLFILVAGRSKADAFVIGNEIADAVTASNPPPIKLKFEKVMYPSILQTKKRYCGYMYETPEQETPTYLAKGIETVRRDGCPAVSKILEKTLKILFETKDVSLVKKYVTRQLDKVLRGKASLQDLTFAKEFRGLKGYRAKACVPALELTRRLMRKDPRAVPRNSERVRYIIVAGAPNQALIHCVRTPWELINDPGLRPNAIYYVTRVIIPPLNRCLNLMGVDVNAWYREMPHRQILNNPVGQPADKQKLTIFQYFGTIVCVACGQPSSKGICMECLTHPADTLVVLHEKLRWLHRTNDQVTAICQSCVGQADEADCSSLDCPVLYRRAQAQRELSQSAHLQSIIECGNNLEF